MPRTSGNRVPLNPLAVVREIEARRERQRAELSRGLQPVELRQPEARAREAWELDDRTAEARAREARQAQQARDDATHRAIEARRAHDAAQRDAQQQAELDELNARIAARYGDLPYDA